MLNRISTKNTKRGSQEIFEGIFIGVITKEDSKDFSEKYSK